MISAGAVRTKNVTNILLKNFLDARTLDFIQNLPEAESKDFFRSISVNLILKVLIRV